MMETKAVVKIPGKVGFEVETLKLRSIEDDEILVKMKFASICGTDVHLWKLDPYISERIKRKVVVGHEGMGEVVEVGANVTDLKVGDSVSFESHIFCDKCKNCLNGIRHLCENMEILGVDRDGLFSEFVILPARNAWKVGKEILPEHAAIFEPLGNSVYCLARSNVKNKNILVLGCGPAGLFLTMMANKLEAKRIICIEKSPVRIEIAKKVGATFVFSSPQDIPKELQNFDVVFEMSGNEKLISFGLEILSPTGTFVAFGLPPQNKVEIDYITHLINKCITIYGIHGRLIFGSWYQLNLLYPLIKEDLNKVFTHRFNYLEVEKGINAILSNEAGKVLLTF